MLVEDVSKLKLKNVKLSEQDVQDICDALLTYLQAKAPIDTRIAAILNDQQSEGELLKTVTKKSRTGTRSRAAEAAGDCSMRARRSCWLPLLQPLRSEMQQPRTEGDKKRLVVSPSSRVEKVSPALRELRGSSPSEILI